MPPEQRRPLSFATRHSHGLLDSLHRARSPNNLSCMTSHPPLSRCIVSVAAAALLLAGCASEPTETSSEPPADATTQTESVTESPTEAEPESASPEPEVIETHTVGTLVQLPSADFIVRTIEERDTIPSSNPDYTPDYEPGDGERLWYFDIEWTNNTLDAVKKECHGPYKFDLRVYDIDGAEMLMVDQPGRIDGQNCSTGLRQGETGRWQSAFYGRDAEFGWAVFIDYADEEAFVTIDPDIELTRNS